MKVLLLPLDSRPCCHELPRMVVESRPDIELVVPPVELLGRGRTPAPHDELRSFLLGHVAGCDYLVASVDMLVYGGLLPSRIHEMGEEEATGRLALIEELRRLEPALKVYAFSCVTRAAAYDSDAAEPRYCATYGRALFRRAWLLDREVREGLDDEERRELEAISIPGEMLADYERRRETNLAVNLACLDYLERGLIDELVIPQDDSNPYGYTARDQARVAAAVRERRLGLRVMCYPGADEVAMTLIARADCDARGASPRVYPLFSSVLGPQIVPSYEDRPMAESLRLHVAACGARLAQSVDEADFVLAVNAPGKVMQEASTPVGRRDVSYATYRSAPAFARTVAGLLAEGREVALCDSAFANGGDAELVGYLDELGALGSLRAYAGWNTNCNSLGTTLAQAIVGPHDQRALVARVLDDVFYQADVRQRLVREWEDPASPEAECWLASQLEGRYAALGLAQTCPARVRRAYLPWGRTFEVACDLTFDESAKEVS